MSALGKKLYQLIIHRLDGDRIDSPEYKENIVQLVEKGIGGFIVFGGQKEQLRNFIKKVQSIAGTPLFIASDIERGAGQQVAGATHFPGQMALAAAAGGESTEPLEKTITAVAQESIDIGINMPLIPVLDVNAHPDNPIICTRAFSDNPDRVARYGSQCVTTLESAGLFSCAKHFPGHGDTDRDSHISLPVIAKPLHELKTADMLPFEEAIRSGVSSIMVGHLQLPDLDDKPATLSDRIVNGLLRKDLGFDGPVMTDALNMHALDSMSSVPAQCLNAGIDLLLHPADPDRTAGELHDALRSGQLSEATLDTALKRIAACKLRLPGIHHTEVDYSAHGELAAAISDASITLVQAGKRLLPVRDMHAATILFSADRNRHDLSTLMRSTGACVDIENTSAGDAKDTVIVALFTSIAAWQGSSGISNGHVQKIQSLMDKSRHSIVVSFGSPYVLRHFRNADALIAAYDSSPLAQSSVIRCLKGEKPFQGRLPVRIFQ